MAAEARSVRNDPGKNSVASAADRGPTFSGSPSEQSSTTGRDLSPT